MLPLKISKKSVVNFGLLNMGIIFIASGTYYFRNPNGFALGGVTGISLLLAKYLPMLPMGLINLSLNIILLLIGLVTLGKTFAQKTVYGTIALSVFLWILELLFPLTHPLTDEKILELVFAVFLPGIGSAIVFNVGGTTGGMDIVAKIISKIFHLKIGNSLLVANFLIAASAYFVFGIEACLFSIVGVFLYSFAVDAIFESLQVYKIITIVSENSISIKTFICNDLKRGATVYDARGAFTEKTREVITTVVSRSQAIKLQQFVKEADPEAFLTIANSYRIIGKGFEVL